jgi:hypothetical protein
MEGRLKEAVRINRVLSGITTEEELTIQQK